MEHEELFEKYLTNQLSDEEAMELKRLLDESDDASQEFIAYAQEWCLMANVSKQLRLGQVEIAAVGEVLPGAGHGAPLPAVASRRSRVLKFSIPLVAVAAIAVLAVGLPVLLESGLDADIKGVYEIAEGGGIRRGATVVTRQQAAELNLGGYCQVRIEPRTRVQIRGRETNEEVFLESGELSCNVDRRGGGFQVETEVATVSVTGTRFTLRVDRQPFGEGARLFVEVAEGTVTVNREGRFLTLGAGQSRVLVKYVEEPDPWPLPKPELAQAIKGDQFGVEDMEACNDLHVHGDTVYYVSDSFIRYFRTEPRTGWLVLAGEKSYLAKDTSFARAIAFLDGRMYCVAIRERRKRYVDSALVWYDIDPKSGEPVERGTVECPPSEQILVGPDQKTLYLHDRGVASVALYKVAADGRPRKVDEIAGVGLDAAWGQTGSGLRMSSDGRHCYTVRSYRSKPDGRIVWLERGVGGTLTFKNSVPLSSVVGEETAFRHASLWLHPGGNYAYISLVKAVGHGEVLMYALTRDPESGALSVLAEQDASGLDGVNDLVFEPDGKCGYAVHGDNRLAWFACNPDSGQLTFGDNVSDVREDARRLALDARNGRLYVGAFWGDADGKNLSVFRVFKTGRKASEDTE